jgi:hypothetical protein
VADIEDSGHLATAWASGRVEQGRLFDCPPATPRGLLVATHNLLHDQRTGARMVVLETLDRGPDACFGRRHRCRQGETVKVPLWEGDGLWTTGVVLTEGFDVRRRHVGWVGVPGREVLWRQLCGLAHGDDDELARARERAEAAGIVARGQTWW